MRALHLWAGALSLGMAGAVAQAQAQTPAQGGATPPAAPAPVATPVPAPVPAPASPFAAAQFSRVQGHGGVPLNVLSQGEATRPSVVLVHGYRQSHLSWQTLFAGAAARHCRLVAYDLRGHGNSGQPWQAEAYADARAWADDLAAVIRAQGLQRPLLVGWSFGGQVLMDFLRLHPDLPVAGLVLVDTPAGLLPAPAVAATATAAPPRPVPSTDLALNVAAAQRSAQLVLGDGVPPAVRQQLAAASMRVSPLVDQGVAARGPVDNTDLLPRLRQLPVTLVSGGRDPIFTPAQAAQLQALLPSARVAHFESAGHAPFLDDPQRFAALLEELACHLER